MQIESEMFVLSTQPGHTEAVMENTVDRAIQTKYTEYLASQVSSVVRGMKLCFRSEKRERVMGEKVEKDKSRRNQIDG